MLSYFVATLFLLSLLFLCHCHCHCRGCICCCCHWQCHFLKLLCSNCCFRHLSPCLLLLLSAVPIISGRLCHRCSRVIMLVLAVVVVVVVVVYVVVICCFRRHSCLCQSFIFSRSQPWCTASYFSGWRVCFENSGRCSKMIACQTDPRRKRKKR